ncbi:NAD(P)/FAD-dependent oxidoreductase [Candidatus Uabimicrobium sp. HlEnr_7]|uniref:NAD(P)/FAD-dependent oxidoreductase n=1 Tax=Candidatus Uabimicrobium helgolandensis TaxID=3095367 RepID=UPI00355769A9
MSRVLIVGGGPAGLSVAITLAQKNVACVVVEKSCWPRDKVCGEGLMPTGVHFLQKYNIDKNLPEDGYYPFAGIRYLDGNIIAQAHFKSGDGFGIRRLHLSNALLQTARGFSCVEIREKTQLQSFSRDEIGIDAVLSCAGNSLNERFSVIIGADGLRSKVKKIAGLEGRAPGKQKRWGGRQHFAVTPWSPYVEIRWRKGIEAYVTPSGENRVEIAFLWEREKLKPRKKDWFGSLLELFPDLYEKVRDCKELSKAQGIGPLAVGCSSAVDDRIILIGDAQVYLDGITGEGISMAFEQAEIVSEELPQLLIDDRLQKKDLQVLAKKFKKPVRRYVLLTRLALLLTRYPVLRRGAMRSLSRSSTCFQHFLESNMGAKPLWYFPLFSSWQLLWGLLVPKRITDVSSSFINEKRDLIGPNYKEDKCRHTLTDSKAI